MMNEKNLGKIYRVYTDEDGMVPCPQSNTVTTPGDKCKYELINRP